MNFDGSDQASQVEIEAQQAQEMRDEDDQEPLGRLALRGCAGEQAFDVAYQQDQGDQRAEGNQNRESQFLTFVDSCVSCCQTIQYDVSKEWQTCDPSRQHEQEVAYLIVAIQSLSREEEKGIDSNRQEGHIEEDSDEINECHCPFVILEQCHGLLVSQFSDFVSNGLLLSDQIKSCFFLGWKQLLGTMFTRGVYSFGRAYGHLL